MQGKLIVVEGPDGCGKTTLADTLVSTLTEQGKTVHHWREPGTTPLGELLRGVLKRQVPEGDDLDARAEALLFVGARAQLAARIQKVLQVGEWVLLDRFEMSTLVYQGVIRGLGVQRMLDLSSWARGSLRPDLMLVLTADWDIIQARRGSREEQDYWDVDSMQYRIHQAYGTLEEYLPALAHTSILIDANGDAHSVFTQCIETINRECR